MNFPWFDAFMTLLFLFAFAFGIITLVLYIHFVFTKISNLKNYSDDICKKNNTNSNKE
nr:MAG TPA: hypothetical protein [Caudoviricetes sp.]